MYPQTWEIIKGSTVTWYTYNGVSTKVEFLRIRIRNRILKEFVKQCYYHFYALIKFICMVLVKISKDNVITSNVTNKL